MIGQARQVSDAQFTLAEIFDRMASAHSRGDLPADVQLPVLAFARTVCEPPQFSKMFRVTCFKCPAS